MIRDSPEQSIWDRLVNKPGIPIPIPPTAASVKLYTAPCLVDGWVLRETTGAAPALVEFIDGLDAGGYIIGEQFVPGPSANSGVNVDTDIDVSNTGAAAQTNASLPGVAGQTTFITGFEVTGGGATAASVIAVTVTGILGGTKTYELGVPAGALAGVTPLVVEYARPIPAAAVNTAIVVTVPSFGAGSTVQATTAHGFQRLATVAGVNAGQTASGPGGLSLTLCRMGIFMRVLSGSVTGSVWAKV
jgi:hypothetical protein